jgi:hypothetical protein
MKVQSAIYFADTLSTKVAFLRSLIRNCSSSSSLWIRMHVSVRCVSTRSTETKCLLIVFQTGYAKLLRLSAPSLQATQTCMYKNLTFCVITCPELHHEPLVSTVLGS